MIKKKLLPKDQLKRLLIDRSILDGIRLGRYTPDIHENVPAKKIPNGRSLMISYYQGRQYICTKHELRRKNGSLVHQDVESVFIDGTRYERL